MAFVRYNEESEFPLPKEVVYSAICKAIPTIKGMEIKNSDELQGRISVRVSISLFSWGEYITIQLISINKNLTKVQINSAPKHGIVLGTALDMEKNRKNIEEILNKTSKIISSQKSIDLQNNNTISNPNNNSKKQNFDFITDTVKTKRHFYKKLWFIVLSIVVFLVILTNFSGNNGNPSANQTNPDKSKEWTIVYEFNGNGIKKSPIFELNGSTARLKYEYQSPSDNGMGTFNIYVVDEGKDVMKEGAFPEVMTSKSEKSESSIQKPKGKYYLNVNAVGDWKVIVEEEK